MDIEVNFSHIYDKIFSDINMDNILFIGKYILSIYLSNDEFNNSQNIFPLDICIYGLTIDAAKKKINEIYDNICNKITSISRLICYGMNQYCIKLSEPYAKINILYSESNDIDKIIKSNNLNILQLAYDHSKLKLITTDLFDDYIKTKMIKIVNNNNNYDTISDIIELNKIYGKENNIIYPELVKLEDSKLSSLDTENLFNGTKKGFNIMEKCYLLQLIPNETADKKLRNYFIDNFYYRPQTYYFNQKSDEKNVSINDIILKDILTDVNIETDKVNDEIDFLGRNCILTNILCDNYDLFESNFKVEKLFDMNVYGVTIFHILCQYKRHKYINYILQNNPGIINGFNSLKDVYNLSPLLYNIINNDMEYFKKFYSDINYNESMNVALICGRYDFVKYLYNGNINLIVGSNVTHILYIAYLTGNEKFFEQVYKLCQNDITLIDDNILLKILTFYVKTMKNENIIINMLDYGFCINDMPRNKDSIIYCLKKMLKKRKYNILKKLMSTHKYLSNYVLKFSKNKTVECVNYTPLSYVLLLSKKNLFNDVIKLEFNRIYTMIENYGGKLFNDCSHINNDDLNVYNESLNKNMYDNTSPRNLSEDYINEMINKGATDILKQIINAKNIYTDNLLIYSLKIMDEKLINTLIKKKISLDKNIFNSLTEPICYYYLLTTHIDKLPHIERDGYNILHILANNICITMDECYLILKIVNHYQPDYFKQVDINGNQPIINSIHNQKLFPLYLEYNYDIMYTSEYIIKQNNIDIIKYYFGVNENLNILDYIDVIEKYSDIKSLIFFYNLLEDAKSLHHKENIFGLINYDVLFYNICDMISKLDKLDNAYMISDLISYLDDYPILKFQRKTTDIKSFIIMIKKMKFK